MVKRNSSALKRNSPALANKGESLALLPRLTDFGISAFNACDLPFLQYSVSNFNILKHMFTMEN